MPCGLRLAGAQRFSGCATLERDPRLLGHGMHVLVTPAGEVDQQYFVFPHRRGQLHRVSQLMAGFERRNDAFEAAQIMESLERFIVLDGDVFGTPEVLQPGMLWTHARIIEPSRYRMRFDNLPVFI